MERKDVGSHVTRGENLYPTLGGQSLRKMGKMEAAIAEGKKPLTTRGSGERRKLLRPRSRRDFQHFMPKWSRPTFLDMLISYF